MTTAILVASVESNDVLIGMIRGFITEQLLQSGSRLQSIWDQLPRIGVKAGNRNVFFDSRISGEMNMVLEAEAFELAINFEKSLNCKQQDEEGGTHSNSVSREGVTTNANKLLEFPEQTLFHVFAVREMLEVELIGLAARKCQLSDLLPLHRVLEDMAAIPVGERGGRYVQLDCDFHLEIAKLSGNDVMVTMLRAVIEEFVPLLQEMSWSEKRSLQTDESHAKLYSSLVEGDVESAQCEMRMHLKAALNAMFDEIRNLSTDLGKSNK